MFTTPRRSLEEALVPILPEDPLEQLTPRDRDAPELVPPVINNLHRLVKPNLSEPTL